MNSVGNLSVAARYAEGGLVNLEVSLERPPVAKLFIGQLPEAIVKTVPYLYTLCAHAQRAAAQAALAAALGEQPRPVDSADLWAEALHEHLWRLLLDWPPALGLPQAREAFINWRAARSGPELLPATDHLFETTLIGLPAADWLDNGGNPAPASLAAACLARLEPDGLAEGFDPPRLTPAEWLAYWREEQVSEPATARPGSVAAAWRARLAEAAQAAVALAAGTPYPLAATGKDGWGVGQTLTARGVLTHAVRLEGGRAAAYRVWAPTDCHFSDAASVATLLGGRRWPDGEAARRALELAVLALDPCLPYTVKVDNA
jgi:hypothetical protein